jgi:hypothetical protein
MKETKEEILAYIKQETGWDDAKCLEWYTQQEESDRSANEPIPDEWIVFLYYNDQDFLKVGIEKNSNGELDRTEGAKKKFTNKTLADEYYKYLKGSSKREREKLLRQ